MAIKLMTISTAIKTQNHVGAPSLQPLPPPPGFGLGLFLSSTLAEKEIKKVNTNNVKNFEFILITKYLNLDKLTDKQLNRVVTA